ncbi:MAG: hypothetical protein WDM88_03720 [Galbitalea sp.]
MTDPVAPVPPAAPVYAPAGPKQALSLTSFITGLAGVVFFWIPFLGFLAGLAGVIFGFIGRKREPAAPKWMSTVGIITGFVGILLNIIFVIATIIVPLIILGTAGATLGTNY